MKQIAEQAYTLTVAPYKCSQEGMGRMVIVTLTNKDGLIFEYVHANDEFAVGEVYRISQNRPRDVIRLTNQPSEGE